MNLCSARSTLKFSRPSTQRSATKRLSPSRPFDPAAVRARTMTKSPLPALMNCLRPSMNQHPSRCVAGRREVADVGARLGLGHRDGAADLAARERREVLLLLLVGAVAEDHRGGRGVGDAVLDHRARARAREHLDHECGDGERKPAAAVLLREREADEPEVGESLDVRLQRLADRDLAVLADHAELVDLTRALRDLAADVLARDRQHLAPGGHGVGDVGVLALAARHDLVPAHDAIEGREQVRVLGEVVRHRSASPASATRTACSARRSGRRAGAGHRASRRPRYRPSGTGRRGTAGSRGP